MRTTRLILVFVMLAVNAMAQESYDVTPGPLVVQDEITRVSLKQFTIERETLGPGGQVDGQNRIFMKFVAEDPGNGRCARDVDNLSECQTFEVDLREERAVSIQNIINKCSNGGTASCDYGGDTTLMQAIYNLPEFTSKAPSGSVGGSINLPTITPTPVPPTPTPTAGS